MAKQQAPATPANKPTGPVMMQSIADTQSELFYALGFLRGTNVSIADRVTELILKLLAAKDAEITGLKAALGEKQ